MRIRVRVALICVGLICLRARSDTVCKDNNPLRCPQVIPEPNIRNNRPTTGFRRYRVFGAANKRLTTPNTIGQRIPRAHSAGVQNGVKLSPTSLTVAETTSSTTARAILSIALAQTSAKLASTSTLITSTIPSITTKISQIPGATKTFQLLPTLITKTVKPTLTPVIDPNETSKAFGPTLHDAAGKDSKFNSDKLLVGPVGGGDNADPSYLSNHKVGLPPKTNPNHRHPTGAITHDQNQPFSPPRGPIPDDGQEFGSSNGNGYENKQNHENNDGYNPQNRPKNTGYDEHENNYSSQPTGQIPVSLARVGYDDNGNHGPGYGPSNYGNVDQTGYEPIGTGRAKPGYYDRPGPGEDGYSGATPFNQPEIKKPGEKTKSEEEREREEAKAERNKVNPKLIGEMSRFSTHSIRTGPRGNSAKLISAKYYYPPKKDLPLPKCFYNGDGYVCCSLELNELMVNVYKSLQADPHFHTCNIGAVTSAVQRHAEERFDTPFETITGFEDYAQKIHFSGELVCKIEIDGKFILAYATPYNAEEAFDANVEDPSKLPADLSAPLGNNTIAIRNPRFRRFVETNTILLRPKIRKNDM